MNATAIFPLAAILLSLAAYALPGWFTPLKPAIVPLLGVVMFGMGMTLTAANFRDVFKRPAVVALGTTMQFVLMPLLAWLLSWLFDLDPVWLVGMVLVGASPGGTASNVICYLARGDVALSITLTTVSTLLAVLCTPLITWAYIGTRVPVDVGAMTLSIAKIVLLPVAAGVVLNHFLHAHLRRVHALFPWVSMSAIVLIIAIIVALNHDQFVSMGLVLLAAVALHNLSGMALGYAIPYALGLDDRTCRTLAIEVGMQNSGLAVTLASKFFTPAAALPGALFSIWHNLSGAWFAAMVTRAPRRGR